MKAGRYVELDGERIQIQELVSKDATIQLFDLTLCVVRSPKDGKHAQSWYILTNDMTSSQTKIVRIYYHRFEIEEVFKDMKYVFEYKRTQLMKPTSLKVLLWFVCLGIVLLYLATKSSRQSVAPPHPKKQLSWLRQAYEQLQRETQPQIVGRSLK